MCLSFTPEECATTRTLLASKVAASFAKPPKSDVILGTHPLCQAGSIMQSIAIWHGTRIEEHFAEWVSRIPGWVSRRGVNITILGKTREVDNLVSNASLGIVIAIETKRNWSNQDGLRKARVKQTALDYELEKNSIIKTCALTSADFRYFVFDAYGKTKFGTLGLPAIICGDKITHIFGSCVWAYMEWERAVIREQVLTGFEVLTSDKFVDFHATDDGSDCLIERDELLSYIDQHKRA